MLLGIYARVSHDEQIKGLSIDNQLFRGQELAEKLGIQCETFVDAGYSGTITPTERPALSRLLDRIYTKGVTHLFITDLDRLTRGTQLDLALMYQAFNEYQIKLYDLSGEIKYQDINVKLLTDIKGILANFEIQKTSARIRTVLDLNAQLGRVGGGKFLAFGYAKFIDEKGFKMLAIDKFEAKYVKYVYYLALSGMGTHRIANRLNDLGIKTKQSLMGTKITMWSDSTVYAMLTNSIYSGKRNYKGNVYDCPSIIDEVTFNQVQLQLKRNSNFKNTTNRYNYLLKGLMRCGKCGRSMYGHKRQDNSDNVYLCSSKRIRGSSCGSRGINIDYLDSLVIRYIDELPESTLAYFQKNFETKEDVQRLTQLIADNEANIVEVRNKMTNILLNSESLGVRIDVTKPIIDDLNYQLDKLEEQRDKANRELFIVDYMRDIILIVSDSVSTFNRGRSDLQFVRIFLQNFIKEIKVTHISDTITHRIKVEFNISQINDYNISRQLLVDRKSRTPMIVEDDLLIIKNSTGEDLSIVYSK